MKTNTAKTAVVKAAEQDAVPPGYKRTEVGVIPEDWDVKTLESLCTSIVDGTHYTPHYVPFGIPFYSVENVTADNFTDVKYIFPEEHASLIRRCRPERGDILLTRIGSLGDTKLIDWDVEASIYVSLALLKLGDGAAPDYVYRYMKSAQFIRNVESRSLINATPKKINMGDIGSIPIPLPPTEAEQRAIAEALSDVDGLIAALDKLIAKKRAIKQTAMQQLLTGKTRLPGFQKKPGYKHTEVGVIPEDWTVLRFSDHFHIYAGGDVPKESLSQIQSEDYPYPIYANAIQNKGLYGFTNVKRGKPDSVTITARGFLGHAEYREEPFFPIVRLIVLEPTGTLDAKYTTYAVNDRVKFSIESTGVPQLTAPQIGKYAVAAPPTKAEQRAIAKVLSDMDAEIEALEQRRAKTQQIKQGMMQQLLTGRVRLVAPEGGYE